MRSRGLRFGAAELNLKGGKSLGKHCRLLGFFLTFTHTLLLPVFSTFVTFSFSLYLSFSLSFTFTLFSHSFSLASFSVLRSLYLFIPLAFVISQSLSLLVFFFYLLASYYFFINHFSLSFSLSHSLITLLKHSLSFLSSPRDSFSRTLSLSQSLSCARLKGYLVTSLY